MFRALLVKELRQAAHDRIVAVCGCGLMVVVALSAFVNARQYLERLDRYAAHVRLHRDIVLLSNSYRDLASGAVTIDRRPEVLSLLVNGVVDDLPPSVAVSLGSGLVSDVDLRLVQNAWRKICGEFDFAFIVLACVSLFAILVTYQGIAGEREAGTLRLVLANPVRRVSILGAKFAAAVALIVVPLACVLLLVVLACGLALGTPVTAGLMLRVAGIWAAAALYATGFVAMGLWFSVMLERPTGVLAASALAWTAAVLIIPSVAILSAAALYPVPSRDMVLEAKRVARDAQWIRWSEREMAYAQSHGHAAHYDVSGDWLLDREFGTARDLVLIDDDYQSKVREQINWGMRFARVSPAFAFHDIASALAGTGLMAHQDFVDAVRAFRVEFARTMLVLVKTADPPIPDPTATLDPNRLPAFQPPAVSIGEALRRSAPSAIALLVFLAIGATGAVRAFVRMSV